MKYNPLSRRMFLQGAGSVLAIPVLESLLPSVAQGQAAPPPVRYIQFINPYSVTPQAIYGDTNSGIIAALKANPGLLQTVSPNIRRAALSGLPAGDLAFTLGPEISALRNKISILRGLDVLKSANDRGFAHGFALPTCAAGPVNDDQTGPPTTGQPSLDCIMADSLKVYAANHANNRRLVNLGPPGRDLYNVYEKASFSWKKTASGLERVQLIQSTSPVFDLFRAQTGDPNSSLNGKLGLAMDQVHADYAKVKSNPRLSKKDQNRLQDYMDLLTDIKNGFANSGGGACTLPAMGPDSTTELQFENQTRVLAAAMMCGLTRVASIALHFNIATVPDAHGQHHTLQHDPNNSQWANTLAFYNNVKLFSKRVAYLINYFDGITDKDGQSLLHHSAIYWAQEFGTVWWWGQHSREDFPVVVAGGAGGKLRQGNYIDYRKLSGASELDGHNGVSTLRGIPLNNLLVTFMNCMGLTHADYETVSGAGYGYYPASPENLVATAGSNSGQKAIPDEDYWFSTQGRRSPVPYLYTG